MYDKIEDVETQLIETKAKKQAIEAEKLTDDNIYKVLIYFEKLYAVMNEWMKSIKFKLPIIEEDMEMSLDDDKHAETVCCSHGLGNRDIKNNKKEKGFGKKMQNI